MGSSLDLVAGHTIDGVTFRIDHQLGAQRWRVGDGGATRVHSPTSEGPENLNRGNVKSAMKVRPGASEDRLITIAVASNLGDRLGQIIEGIERELEVLPPPSEGYPRLGIVAPEDPDHGIARALEVSTHGGKVVLHFLGQAVVGGDGAAGYDSAEIEDLIDLLLKAMDEVGASGFHEIAGPSSSVRRRGADSFPPSSLRSVRLCGAKPSGGDRGAFALKEPTALADRPHHGRFPIPFVTHVRRDGRPDFRVHDNERREQCARERLCQLCGQDLGDSFVFVGFLSRLLSRRFGEPPMHRDCMEWAWEVCPWLAGGDWRAEWREAAAELEILPQPGGSRWMVVYTTDNYRLVEDEDGSGRVKWVAARPTEALDYRDRAASRW